MIVRDTVYPLSLPPVSGGIQNSTASYPSYFKLHVRWLYLLTPVAYALYAAGVLLCRRLPAARIIEGYGWRCGIKRSDGWRLAR